MNLVKVEHLFNVSYGVNIDLNKLEEVEQTHPNAIRYVGRSEKNNGVTAFVLRDDNHNPNPAMTISVAGGGSVMSSFLQEAEYYSGRDLFYLQPKANMSKSELLFYCTALKMNKFKFSYGRQANTTLRSLLIPIYSDFPDLEKSQEFKNLDVNEDIDKLVGDLWNRGNINTKRLVRLDKLFKTVNGLSSTNLAIQPTRTIEDLIPFVRPSKWQNSSYAGYVARSEVDRQKIFPAGTLYISTNGAGSHTYSYVSIEDFLPNSDVSVLIPKKAMTLETKLLYSIFITANRFKFSYGRKPKGKRIAELLLPDIIS